MNIMRYAFLLDSEIFSLSFSVISSSVFKSRDCMLEDKRGFLRQKGVLCARKNGTTVTDHPRTPEDSARRCYRRHSFFALAFDHFGSPSNFRSGDIP